MSENNNSVSVRMEIFKMLLDRRLTISTNEEIDSLLKQAEKIANFVLKDDVKTTKIVIDKSIKKVPKRPTVNTNTPLTRGSAYKASDLF